MGALPQLEPAASQRLWPDHGTAVALLDDALQLQDIRASTDTAGQALAAQLRAHPPATLGGDTASELVLALLRAVQACARRGRVEVPWSGASTGCLVEVLRGPDSETVALRVCARGDKADPAVAPDRAGSATAEPAGSLVDTMAVFGTRPGSPGPALVLQSVDGALPGWLDAADAGKLVGHPLPDVLPAPDPVHALVAASAAAQAPVWLHDVPLPRWPDGRDRVVDVACLPRGRGQIAVLLGDLSVDHWLDSIRDDPEPSDVAAASLRDELTGLAGRVLLRDRLELAVQRARRHESTAAVVFVDLDDFKAVNDRYGHTVGDELLRAVAARLRTRLRSTDTAARLGGDEFVLLYEDLDRDQEAVRIAVRTAEQLRRPYQLSVGTLTVTASVGVALSGSRQHTAEDLLHEADLAMYEAKKRGKARWAVYDESHHQQAVQRLQLVDELRAAFGTRQLRLQYQPIVAATGGRLLACEALLRWRHPVHGLLRPRQFLAVAEAGRMLDVLGSWVVYEASGQLRDWRRAHPGADALTVAVNVSPGQLGRGTFAQTVQAALRTAGLEPGSLLIEVPAADWPALRREADADLVALARRGVRVSLDGFGLAPVSLPDLDRGAVSQVKLDRAITTGLDDPETAAAARLAVDLAHAAGLTVVAQGVRTQAQAEALRRLGCDALQGFLVGRPRAAQGLTPLLDGEA